MKNEYEDQFDDRRHGCNDGCGHIAIAFIILFGVMTIAYLFE
jgi:hypothetical protein